MVARSNQDEQGGNSMDAKEISGIIEVSPQELQAMMGRGECVVVDVREPEEHAREHIEGSELMPLSKFEPQHVPVGKEGGGGSGGVVVLHCRSGMRSAEAARRLMAIGGCEVRTLAGGIRAWREAGLPIVENRRVPISVMRQVQITAGSMVVAGTVLGALFSPWWLLLSGFVGAGLVFAGVSGTCGLAAVLGRMPWNRMPEGAGGGNCSAA